MSVAPLFRPVAFGDLPGWQEDDHDAAFAAFRRSAAYALNTPYRTGALGVEASAFVDAFTEAVSTQPVQDGQAKVFFERNFVPFLVAHNGDSTGFVTGFYEPQLMASPVRTKHFSVPLLGVPDDLVKVDDDNCPAGFDFAFGREGEEGIVEYFDRGEIEAGALGAKARPLAWLTSKVDAFFVHVQGCARLVLPDGTTLRLTYAAKSGHPFTGPGRLLAELGEIAREDVTMQSIRAWFRQNPHRIDEILHQNRSYIFFRETEVSDPALGPMAAAKVPLTPGRSLAVDRLLHTFATPFFVDSPMLTVFGEQTFRRLMIAQDTGSAIVGPARGDIFAGCGDAAGDIAGVIRHPARFFALLPRGLAGGPA